MLSKRHAARKALNDADADRRLRRALNLKYKGTNSEYALGQQVWFWRDARQPDLVKIRWLGPAQVVMKERRPGADEAVGLLASVQVTVDQMRTTPCSGRCQELQPCH